MAFFEDVIADLRRRGNGLRFVATTLPGHAGTPPPKDLSPVSYARSAAELAKDLGCDIVVGHSMGATVAIEMAAVRRVLRADGAALASLLATGRARIPVGP